MRTSRSVQVTLSLHAEQLLREALARNPEHSPAEVLEQLLNEDAQRHAAETTDALWQRLQSIPGIRLPEHWPPRFAQFEPMPVEGEPVSEQLIRERR